jgi:ferrochelatase
MKHSPPYVEDAARSIADEGHDRAIGVALAPFRSRLSTEGYYRLAEAANPNGRIAWRFAADWHLDEGFLALWHERIQEALARASSDAVLILTNHSLPARILDWNDPYPAQFTATAEALALRLGRDAWSTAYQSAGGGDAPWLGPRLFEVVATWMDRGRTEFVVAPIGFLMDHLEVLYDLDVEAARMARELRISIYRTRMPNDDPALVELLARQILLAG